MARHVVHEPAILPTFYNMVRYDIKWISYEYPGDDRGGNNRRDVVSFCVRSGGNTNDADTTTNTSASWARANVTEEREKVIQ